MKTTRKAIYDLWDYDLVAEPEGGYTVNDRWRTGTVVLKLRLTTYNEGTPFEFKSWTISDRAINRTIPARKIEWDGEMPPVDGENSFGCVLYGTFNHKCGKYAESPACELVFNRWEDEDA